MKAPNSPKFPSSFADQKAFIEKLSQPGQPLHRSNLNFFDCPEEQHGDCLWYEVGRESPSMIRLTEEYRKYEQQPDSMGEDGWLFKGVAQAQLRIIAVCPEFPKTPWLDIPQAARQERVKNLVRTWERMGPPPTPKGGLRVVPISDEDFPLLLERCHLMEKYPDVAISYQLQGVKTLVVEINTDRPQGELIREFKEWLKAEHRRTEEARKRARKALKDKGQPVPAPPNPYESRGRKDNPYDWLRKLGAWRILKATGCSLKEAVDHFGIVYANTSEWSQARSKINQLIKRLFENEVKTEG